MLTSAHFAGMRPGFPFDAIAIMACHAAYCRCQSLAAGGQSQFRRTRQFFSGYCKEPGKLACLDAVRKGDVGLQ